MTPSKALLYACAALGTVLALWAIAKAAQDFCVDSAIHRPVSARKAQPDVHRIVALGPRAVEPLCAAIAEAWSPKDGRMSGSVWFWLVALGEIGDSRATPTVIALADAPDPEVRLAAAHVLYKLEDCRGVPAMRRLAADPDKRIREFAEAGLTALEVSRGDD